VKPLGIVLVIIGLLGLAYGGLSWTRKDKIVDAGPIQISANKKETLPIPPIAGGLFLVAGIVLLARRD
jgi:uncharacterized membrane protein YidH (DUF202 family)